MLSVYRLSLSPPPFMTGQQQQQMTNNLQNPQCKYLSQRSRSLFWSLLITCALCV